MEIFADGIMNVVLTRGLVRIDWYSLSPTEVGPDGAPSPEFKHRLIVHPDNLPQVLDSLRFAVDALRERGVLSSLPAAPLETTGASFQPAGLPDAEGGHDEPPPPPPPTVAEAKPMEPRRAWSANFPSTVTRSEDLPA